jgi:mannose-6-phosphate isomerase-like protein (cupin superfamily)
VGRSAGILVTRLILSAAFLFACPALSCHAQTIRLLRFSEGEPFHMGSVTSMRIIQPGVGAKQLTLNYSASQSGSEFAQHVHDYSDDTILVLQGQADLRQGDTRTPIKAGTCAFVPAGQIHGTITTAPDTIMISFQVPPDLVLYTGARDSSRPGAAPPKGVITPGAVKYVDFAGKNGFFVYPGMIARRAAAAHRVLQRGESFTTSVDAGAEQLLFVWKGAIAVAAAGRQYQAGEKDTIFAAGSVSLEVSGDSAQPATVFQVESPPRSGEVWK